MVEQLKTWLPIALMLVPFARTWRLLGVINQLMESKDRVMPWVVRERSRAMQRCVGQLLVLMGVWLLLQGGDNAWTLLLVGGAMWRLPGLFTGMVFEEDERDHKEPIGPEPRPMDYDEPIGPEDRRLALDGTPLGWETCYRCRIGIIPIEDEDEDEYWLDAGAFGNVRIVPICPPGGHFPQSRLAPEDREGVERWLEE